MTSSVIREKLHDYINVADERKLQAIYTILEEDINSLFKWWQDENFIAELNESSDNLKTGKDKGLNWEQTKDLLLKSKR